MLSEFLSANDGDEDLVDAWRDRSFLLEMKPRAEFASLFIDCPPAEESGDFAKNDGDVNEFVRVRDNSLEILDDVNVVDDDFIQAAGPAALATGVHHHPQRMTRFSTRIADICMVPNSVCALSWADHGRRLFMCKVRVDSEDGVPFSRKTFRSFEEELRSRCPIGECVDEMLDAFDELKVLCRHCRGVLHTHFKRNVDFDVLPDDDWLDTSPSMEYFCGQSCGHGGGGGDCGGSDGHGGGGQHHHQRHPHPYYEGLLGISSRAATAPLAGQNPATRWLPSAKKVVFTNSFLMLLESTALKNSIDFAENERLLTCRFCTAQIGITLRANKFIYKLHVGAVEIFGSGGALGCEIAAENGNVPRDYILSRFKSFENYFAWMFLYKSESQSSMKLLIRTYDHKPFLLIWLLEPYVIMAGGILRRVARSRTESADENLPPKHVTLSRNSSDDESVGDEEEEVQPFAALKILYKIYDAESAAADPRANGGDSSIGIVDIPRGCCLQLAEILLQSSHSLPPTLRAVGQLYVGYLRIGEGID